jgi:hypothetical protein
MFNQERSKIKLIIEKTPPSKVKKKKELKKKPTIPHQL